ncbi:MAG: hypothetical protein LBV12_10100 [Puniceicoccales bacterium]|jgi:hypothetical protein|nr:hypothetical protein [Puniceicoccales bacterium]
MKLRFYGKAWLALAAMVASLSPVSAGISLKDTERFPVELYPGINDKTQDEVMLAGMAVLYPGRVTRTPLVVTATDSARKPVSAMLHNQIAYIRCYGSDASLYTPAAGAKGVIVDLRYFGTSPETVSACVALCRKISGTSPVVKGLGDYPVPAAEPLKVDDTAAPARVVVLVNKGTAGPIEPMLADLQAKGKVILVGTATAGATARYRQLDATSGWWTISGELCTGESKRSLVGSGVLPKVQVAVSAENDLLAWHWIERGVSPLVILRLSQSNGNNGSAEKKNNAAASEGDAGQSSSDSVTGTDLVLQRGYDILAALQVMESMTASAK